VDNDCTPLVADIVKGLKVDSMADPKVVTEKEANEAVKNGKAAVAVVFPKGFEKAAPNAMFRGDAPVVKLRYDPSKNMEMQAVQGSIMQVAMQKVSQNAFSPRADFSDQLKDIDSSTQLKPEQKRQFHDLFATIKDINAANVASADGGAAGMRQPFTLKAKPQAAKDQGGDKEAQQKASLAHTFAGMAMQGVLFYGINAAMLILRDRRLGVWRRLRASPVTLGEILAGKGLSTALIGALVLGGVLAFGMAVFGIRSSGSLLGLLLVLVASSLMVSAFGLLVASLGRTEEQSRGLSTLAVLAMVMLGGGWFPTFMMPDWVQKLSLIVPVRWALDGFDAMLWRGQGLVEAMVPVAGLLVFTAIFAAVAAFRFKTMPETA
ncbi:ABC-2 transporter permease, partial [bacterium]